ncbi:transmembrane protein 256 homolog isoform X2 [Ceratina calcarata]|uniref:Transmembrane protein 256 homolog isoform X2 n=1 Tax=Ceratina calcarata TaxID=156304 RepID=A0AAJ7JFM7_9HYME|nr:transmembrane protein 256 homolog isoform X2 [Ceratina calcarata]
MPNNENINVDYNRTQVTGYLVPRAETKMPPPVLLWKLAAATGPYVRLAAISGAVAVGLGAYGAHKQYPEESKVDLKQVFETASRYHFVHTLALLGVPLCRKPFLAATFLLSGIIMFSGPCYYFAFTGNKQFNTLAPIGGVCFIIGWLSMCI